MIYGIGDLHFDPIGDKPMDIFGENWLNHEDKIIENWKRKIKYDDIVILAGDISWALKMEEVDEDLRKIEELPGKKILIKGNHDYWWSSLKKLRDLKFKTIEFIQNNSYIYNNVGIFGTRGWSSIDMTITNDHDIKIFNRELNRLKLSLDSCREALDKKIVVLHYPPFNINGEPNEFVDIMKNYKVDICIYGHLHAEGHKYIVEGLIDGIDFQCISSDYIEFNPRKIL